MTNKYVFTICWGDESACDTSHIPFECDDIDEFKLQLATTLEKQGFVEVFNHTLTDDYEIYKGISTLEDWFQGRKEKLPILKNS